MAIFAKKSTVVLLVLSNLALVSCEGKLTPSTKPVKVGEAVGQMLCGMDTYDVKSDKCSNVTVSKTKNLPPVDVSSILPIVQRDLRVIEVVAAEKGQGCMEMTKVSKLPLSAKACRKLFNDNDRDPLVFISPHGAVKYYDPIVKIGEEWYLMEDAIKKEIFWKIPKG